MGGAAAMQALKKFGQQGGAGGQQGGMGGGGAGGLGGMLGGMMGGGQQQGGGGGGAQNQFSEFETLLSSFAVYVTANASSVGMAMKEAAQLFDKQSASGNVAPGANKQDAVSSAAQMALKMFLKSEMGGSSGGGGAMGMLGGMMGGGGGSSGAGGLLSMASKFL